MKVWWITLATTFFICLVARYLGNFRYNRKFGGQVYRANIILSITACAILICVSGLRTELADTAAYVKGFKEITGTWHQNATELLQSDMKDKGFYLFTRWIYFHISDNPQVYIFIISLFTITMIFIVFYKYSDLLEMAIFLFITSGAYLVTMNGIRQYLASAILFMAFPWIEEKKWYLYIPLVLCVSTIHTTALIFIPIYFIVGQKAWGKSTKLIVLVGIFLFLSYPITGPMLADLLHESQYSEYSGIIASSGGGANMLRVVVMSVPVVLAYLGRNYSIMKRKYYDLVVNMSVLNLMTILLATRYWIYARFNIYFLLYMIILLCWCIKDLFDEKNGKLIYLSCLFCYLLFFYYEMVISFGWGMETPFFYWE